MHRGEELLFTRVTSRLPEPVRERLLALIAATDPGDEDSELEDGAATLGPSGRIRATSA